MTTEMGSAIDAYLRGLLKGSLIEIEKNIDAAHGLVQDIIRDAFNRPFQETLNELAKVEAKRIEQIEHLHDAATVLARLIAMPAHIKEVTPTK
jgi:hypothetical protein